MKNYIYLFIFLAVLSSSCSEEPTPPFTAISIMARITVLDAQGNNLLDPKREGSFKANEIKIFYERNGKMEEFYEGHLDMPRNFQIIPPEFGSDYLISVVLSEKTVIKWNTYEIDTLTAEIQRFEGENGGMHVRKVYHNGELKHDSSTSMTRREFTIVKQRP